MSSTLYRLGRTMGRARWRVIGVWALLVVVLGGLALALGGQLSAQFEIPGTQAQEGLDELGTRFPQMGGTSGQLVFTTDDDAAPPVHVARALCRPAGGDHGAVVAHTQGAAPSGGDRDDVRPGGH